MTSERTWNAAFRSVLAREAGADAAARVTAAAARGLCEQFVRRVAPLIGETGMTAVCDRALHLVNLQTAGLSHEEAAGQHDDGPSARLERSLARRAPADATVAAINILTTIADLLASFIGESLTTRLLREAWPDDFADETAEESTT